MRLPFGDPAGTQQLLHMCVIARALEDAAATQQVHAAVPDVSPERACATHEARCAGRAGPHLRGQIPAERDDCLMRPPERQVQQTVRIEQRPARCAEFLEHRLHGRLGGPGPVCVPTHAIHDRKQCVVAIGDDGDPVLVFFAIAEETQFSVLDLQRPLPHAGSQVNFGGLYSTPHRRHVSGAPYNTKLLSRVTRPMIRSMTGFARRERQGPWGTLTCELRSVNHRYLELSLRLPEDLRGLETDARRVLAGSLRRGKVDAGLYLRGATALATAPEINRPLLEQLLAGATEVRSLAGEAAGPLDPLDLLRWPGVIRESERDVESIAAAAMDLLGETAADLNDSRAREGARLRDMLLQRLELLRESVSNVRARLPDVAARIRARVLERVTQLGATVDPERLEQEIALIAYKMDVEEELDRLGSHITETVQVLESQEPAGRRLDFLMQEFNREANTLSSKSQDAETTRAAVDMKVLIEQMREQVQNVE
jgi:uncharacterized protein (TIGR00255 family)